ncbi:uncharacterized protein LOC133742668 [Rosa rugosa]|uniref:uncharacterized protein LOC133742668 n=1 Tax=Rosa rugosa TaxID=74645 RepID=UPI002B403B77|nr:uncharacterized protein LOC133742668 [Rosa rugosa]
MKGAFDLLLWEAAPPPNWVKLHFDGAYDVKNGRDGMGAVVRDEFGRMQGALAVPVDGSLSPLATEAAALRYGILYCKELSFTKVKIEGDALNVLKALDCNDIDLSEIEAVIEDVKHVMVEMEMVKWKHVWKKYNQLARALARLALTMAESMFCKEISPIWLQDLVEKYTT